jgi:2-polyprenyl-3-methyl-5-hydroxy-6-metoxy-1,4-benzoquinol methylase
MDLSQRSYQKELLDRDDIPFPDIKRNMQELDFINTYLGGHAITCTGLKKILLHHPSSQLPRETVVCEIGCGGGDNLRAIAAWCTKRNIKVSFVGIDINVDCIQVAIETCKELPAKFIHSDYKMVQFEKVPDILFSSLFCHHFSNQELIGMLQWMEKNSNAGFFINDLHRHPLAYFSIKWLSRIFSKSYLVKNDAPLSVARGFSKLEWSNLLQLARISNFSISWKWAFRWLIVAINNPQSSLINENRPS